MAFVTLPALPTARVARPRTICNVRMVAQEKPSSAKVTRRAVLAGAIAAVAAVFSPNGVLAEREYANVGYLGGMDEIDINNANVHAYMKYKGFYPNLAGLIAANGPYKNVDEVFNLPGLSENQKKTLEKYRSKLVALKPVPEYEIDKINNGAYK